MTKKGTKLPRFKYSDLTRKQMAMKLDRLGLAMSYFTVRVNMERLTDHGDLPHDPIKLIDLASRVIYDIPANKALANRHGAGLDLILSEVCRVSKQTVESDPTFWECLHGKITIEAVISKLRATAYDLRSKRTEASIVMDELF